MQKLHLIVPLGKEASRGDQLENAAYFEKKGYARQLAEDRLTLENLQDELNPLHDLKFYPFSSERKIYTEGIWEEIENFIK